MDATELFENAMKWLRQHYTDYRFFAERDIVWTVQLWLHSEIDRQALSFSVFNDHTLIDSPRASADLVLSQTCFRM